MDKSQQWPQFLVAFLASFLSIGSGIQMGWTSPSLPKLLSGELGFSISQDEASYVVMLSPLGYVIGSPLCGFLLDKVGRKYTLLMLAPIQLMTWITISLSDSVLSLYSARILMGISDSGIYTTLPAYIGEVVEPKIRGRASTSHSLGLLIGILLINIYGSFTSIRTAAYISLTFPILFAITFIWMPESPYFLIAKGNEDKARKALKALRRMANVDEELGNIQKFVAQQMAEPGRLMDIFTNSGNLKAFLIITVLRTVQQMSGMFVISLYIQIIFQIADADISPQISAIVCTAVRVPLIFIGSSLVDRFGRRIMISSSSISTAITLAGMGSYFYLQAVGFNLENFKWVPLSAMVIYYISCSMGLLMVPTIMMGELFPSNIKAKSLALMNIYFGLSMGATAKMFQWTEASYGVHVPFYIFAIVCVLGVVYTHVFVPETKGKSLEEIQQILKGTECTKL